MLRDSVEYFLHLLQRVQTRLGFFAIQPVHESIVGIPLLEEKYLVERFQDGTRTNDYLVQPKAFYGFGANASIEGVDDAL